MASLRVSTVLTFLLTEQMLLAYILLPELRDRFWTLLAYPAHHRDHLPGHVDDRAHVLGAGPKNLDGDGPDLSHAARSSSWCRWDWNCICAESHR